MVCQSMGGIGEHLILTNNALVFCRRQASDIFKNKAISIYNAADRIWAMNISD